MTCIGSHTKLIEKSSTSSTAEFLRKNLPKFVPLVIELLQQQGKEAEKFIDQQLKDKVFLVDSDFLPKIRPVMVQAALYPPGREQLKKVAKLLQSTNQQLIIREADVSSAFRQPVLGDTPIMIFGININLNVSKAIFQHFDGSWHHEQLPPTRTFQHEVQHIIQFLEGRFDKLCSVKNFRWTNEAEKEALKMEDELSLELRKRVTHKEIDYDNLFKKFQFNAKTNEFLRMLYSGCDGNASKQLKEWARKGCPKDDLELFKWSSKDFAGTFSNILKTPFFKIENPVDQQFFQEKVQRVCNIFIQVMQVMSDSGQGDHALDIMDHLDSNAKAMLVSVGLPDIKSKNASI